MFNSKLSLILLFIALITISSCSQKAQCPAYREPTQGTMSLQDTKDMSPDEVRKQSIELLDTQDSYIVVKRSKKTGLVKSKKRKKIKKGKNITRTHKGFKYDPRTMQGVKK